jgi:hypothetical protein
LKTSYQNLSPEQRVEIEQEIARRKRLYGVGEEAA